MPKSHFLMLMRDERLAGLRSHFEDNSNLLTIRESGIVVARGDLESAEGRAAIEAVFATNFAGELKGQPKVISGGGHSFSDVVTQVVSLINRCCMADIPSILGLAIHPLQFRAH